MIGNICSPILRTAGVGPPGTGPARLAKAHVFRYRRREREARTACEIRRSARLAPLPRFFAKARRSGRSAALHPPPQGTQDARRGVDQQAGHRTGPNAASVQGENLGIRRTLCLS